MKDLCTPDKRNINFNITLDSLRSSLSEVVISGKVPERITKMIEVAQKLYLYAFFEYDLYTVSMIYLALLTETAIKERFLIELPANVELIKKGERKIIGCRYSGIYGKLQKGWKIKGFEKINYSLKSIMDWLIQCNVLPDRYKQFEVDSLRNVRNMSAHLESKEIYPPGMAIQFYLRTADFVNCLFDPTVHNNEPTILKETREQYKNVIQQAIDIMERKQNSETDKKYQGGE